MKIKVIKLFNDKENGYVTRPVNEVFEAADARADELDLASPKRKRMILRSCNASICKPTNRLE